ncbi:MAG: hypothetical protein OES46_16815 [Gammaproteobacteria bacterium]|jgi:stalled ribosome rescue protein Dom34|nr:hypothetical protein [Gammaproteobacteria bacterium]
MKRQIRSKWRRDRTKPVSLEDNAVALAYIVWQIALSATKNLHAQDFVYDSDEQRMSVIAEYLVLLVHSADRFAHADMDDAAREHFITTLAQEVARHLQRNQAEIMGPGDYRRPFITLLNERVSEYSQASFADERPGFELLRCFGEKILTVMESTQVNRWVKDQVMTVDAPDAVENLKMGVDDLFGSARTKSNVTLDPE